MRIIHRICAGLDVHRDSVSVCVRVLKDAEVESWKRTFGTMTKEIRSLGAWLSEHGVTHVAMESTGVFWKPLWNILESDFALLLVNPREIKNVPGRKTDQKDCEWICELLQFGLLSPSFVPSKEIRELRDLTRSRTKVIQHRVSVANRIHKVLQDANIKLSSVVSDILGVSSLAMIRALVNGERDPNRLAEMALKRLRAKIPQLRLALDGAVDEHHCYLLTRYLNQLDSHESEIAVFDERIRKVAAPFEEELELLISIKGVQRRTAECLLAEIGPDMTQFHSAKALASWAGVCPGSNESAGKRKSGKTTKGSKWLRRTLGEASWAAASSKNTYFSAQYKRLASRRGKKRAIVAVGHSILIAAYHVLKDRTPYQDLGPDHFDKLNTPRITRYLVKRLERLGHTVTLAEAAP